MRYLRKFSLVISIVCLISLFTTSYITSFAYYINQTNQILTFGGTWNITGSDQDTVFSVNSGEGYKAVLKDQDDNLLNYSNFEYSADIKVGQELNYSDSGLIFRANNLTLGCDTLDGYYAAIDGYSNRVMLGKFNGEWQFITDANIDIAPNTYYCVKVTALDNNIKVYVNNSIYIDYTDTDNPYYSGAIGFRTYDNDAWFSHVQINETPSIVDKNALDNKISDAEDLYLSINGSIGYGLGQYTEAKYNALGSAIYAANAIYNDQNATQAAVDNATADLQNAIAACTPNTTNKSVLYGTIYSCEDTYSDMCHEDPNFEPYSKQAFLDALDAAKYVLDNSNATQEEIDQAAVNLQTAFNSLVIITPTPIPVPVDKTALDNKISDAEDLYLSINGNIGYGLGQYTEDKYNALGSAIYAAKAIYNDQNTTQVAVDNATADLQNVLAACTPNTTNKSVLYGTIYSCEEQYGQMNHEDPNFDPYSEQAFLDALAAAQYVLDNPNATQDEIDYATNNLQTAFDSLVIITPTPIPPTPIISVDNINLTNCNTSDIIYVPIRTTGFIGNAEEVDVSISYDKSKLIFDNSNQLGNIPTTNNNTTSVPQWTIENSEDGDYAVTFAYCYDQGVFNSSNVIPGTQDIMTYIAFKRVPGATGTANLSIDSVCFFTDQRDSNGNSICYIADNFGYNQLIRQNGSITFIDTTTTPPTPVITTILNDDFNGYTDIGSMQTAGWNFNFGSTAAPTPTTPALVTTASPQNAQYLKVYASTNATRTFAPVALKATGGVSPGKNAKLIISFDAYIAGRAGADYQSYFKIDDSNSNVAVAAGKRNASSNPIYYSKSIPSTGDKGLAITSNMIRFTKLKYVIKITDDTGAFLATGPKVDIYADNMDTPIAGGVDLSLLSSGTTFVNRFYMGGSEPTIEVDNLNISLETTV